MMFGLDHDSLLRLLILAVGLYMAWNIGANDVSNAMGTSVGSGALSLKKAVIFASILEFCGAFFVGERVSGTMQHGLIRLDMFSSDPQILVIGMCSALLGTSLWLQVASYFGLPVSTTHAIVGAILGFGALVGGMDIIEWKEVGIIGLSWIISPLISGIISYFIFVILQKKILYTLNPVEATKRLLPFFFFFVFFTFTLCLIFNGLANLNLGLLTHHIIITAFCVGTLAAGICYLIIRRSYKEAILCTSYPTNSPSQALFSLDKAIRHLQRARVSSLDETHLQVSQILKEAKTLSKKLKEESKNPDKTSQYHFVEKMFVYLQIVSACYVAFAHGANDVANAIGPVAAVLDVISTGTMSRPSIIPSWLLALGGLGIVLGLATWGWRVIETIGKKITALTPTRGFCAEFGAATTILIASKLGLPISTTHCLVGSVLGIGLAKGLSALNLSTLRDIVLSWIITIPASAGMSIGCFYGLRALLST